MKEYLILLDDAEVKALEYIAIDPQEWIENALQYKIQVCKDEFFKRYSKKQEEAGLSIKTNIEELIEESDELPASQRIEKDKYLILPDDPFNPSLIP